MKNKSIKNLGIHKGDGSVVESAAELYIPLKKLPSPSAKYNLTTDQKYWYRYYGELLISTNKLAPVDLFHLHRVARSIDYYLQAEDQIQQLGYYGGIVSKTPNNYYQISAHIVARDKMLKDISEVSAHFGFSFLDRKKLTSGESQAPQGDLFNNFNQRKTN